MRQAANIVIVVTVMILVSPALAQAPRGETVRDRLWIWGHPAGVYNDNFLAPFGRASTIEPVAAAERMGLRNMIFVRFESQPAPPFAEYYQPFRRLNRVYWSLVGAGGATSDQERELVYRMAETAPNLVGFILDDFFHGHVTDRAGEEFEPWLAQNRCRFPVELIITAPAPTSCDMLELVQTDWHSGDYRTKDVAVEFSADDKNFSEVAKATLPNEPAATVRLKLSPERFTSLRVRVLSTHDTEHAQSCGLKVVRLKREGKALDLAGWKASASSVFSGFDPANSLGHTTPFRASLTPEQLRELGKRTVRGKDLPIMAVVYTGQISPRTKAHLAEVDQVCLWTWRPADLERLESNLEALETLVEGKPIFLGCYMYDFNDRRPLPVELMEKQTRLGAEWLAQGRIEGMIFLATPNVDVGLEAVEWTRQWIAGAGDQLLPKRADRRR